MTQQMIVYKHKMLKKSSNQPLIWRFSNQWPAMIINTGHHMAFTYSISFATDWAANFGAWFRILLQAFARCHLKSLCCLILIWADTLCCKRLHFICHWLGCKLWLQSIQNHTRRRFQALCSVIWSLCAVQFESFLQTGRWFRSAALQCLHRIQFGTCGFVPVSNFYSETNEWSKNWAKLWALLWSATSSPKFNRKFHVTCYSLLPISTKH